MQFLWRRTSLRSASLFQPSSIFRDEAIRKFSHNQNPERIALLRALRSDGRTDKRRKAHEKKSEDDSTTSPTPNRRRWEKMTFEEFFAHMRETRKGHEGKKAEQEVNIKPTITSVASDPQNDDEATITDTTSKRGASDIISFFDELDAIVEKRKKKSSTSTQEKGPSPLSINRRKKDEYGRMPVAGLFEAKTEIKPRSPDAFDEEAFEKYLELLDTVIEGNRFVGSKKKRISEEQLQEVLDWLMAEEPVVSFKYPLLERAIKNEISDFASERSSESFRSELREQNETFMTDRGWSVEQVHTAVAVLKNIGGLCAKYAAAPPIEVAWHKLKEIGYKMDTDMLHNYLYVTSTFFLKSSDPSSSKKGSSILSFFVGNEDSKKLEEIKEGKEEDTTSTEDFVDVAAEVANWHDLLYEPTEQSMSIRVRSLVTSGQPREAEELLESFDQNDSLRLRTYLPIFRAYIEQDDTSAALKLYTKMRSGDLVILQPEVFVQLMACTARTGYFSSSSPPIEGAEELGYPDACGPQLFDRLATDLAEGALEINSASAKLLYNSFQKGFSSEGIANNLEALHVLEPLKSNQNVAADNELIASRVTLDESNGKCPRSGAQLRLLTLDSEQKLQLRESLQSLAAETFAARHNKTSFDSSNLLKEFGDWLEKREGDPFTVIIDGPNVGYYMQNFDEGKFNYHQIKFLADALEAMGEKVLVTIPEKYTWNHFSLPKASGQVRQYLTDDEKTIRDDLKNTGKLYVVKAGNLDDLYFIYGSISDQENARKGRDLYVPPGNDEGRWPGIRPVIVSNDKLRDHKLSLLEPRLFSRWYSNFIVNYTFSAFVGSECEDKEIGFKTANFYSREIQGNPTLDKDGHQNGIAWHFPVSDWESSESFCVRIPMPRSTK